MFPIRDRRARTIAFGGRTLGTDQPKYLNSPESPLFRKGEGLYGVAEARDAIRAADRAVLVEGYMDALLLVQEGIAVRRGDARHRADRRRSCACCSRSAASSSRCSSSSTATAPAARRRCAPSASAPRRASGGAPRSCPKASIPTATRASTAPRQRWHCSTRRPSLGRLLLRLAAAAGATLPQRTRVADDVKRLLARVGNDVQFELLVRQAVARLGVERGDLPPRPSRVRCRPRTATRAAPARRRRAGRPEERLLRRADGGRSRHRRVGAGARRAGAVQRRRSQRRRRADRGGVGTGSTGRRGDRRLPPAAGPGVDARR